MKTAHVGDWIRYQRDGRLVVGVVAYICPRAPWDSTPIPWTIEHGPVEPAGIREVRSAEVTR